MKKYIAGIIFFGVLFLGCKTENGAESSFKVALLSPGPVSDAGWNAAAYEGLLLIKSELGAQISQIETHNPSEFEQAFRDYARSGYKLVFGHGFEFQDAAAKVGAEFPNTIFITTSGNTVRKNVAPMVFELEHATYLAGALAAMMSTSKKLGAVGGMKIPSVESTFMAFEAGAKAMDPGIQFIQSYIGNWEDAGAARQATLALIDQGCDLIVHNADAAAAGVFQAVADRGVFAFGTNKNQNHIDPDHILASCVSDIPQAFLTMATTVKSGTFESQIFRLGMPENTITFEINPKLEKHIKAEYREKIATLRHAIKSDSLMIPSKI